MIDNSNTPPADIDHFVGILRRALNPDDNIAEDATWPASARTRAERLAYLRRMVTLRALDRHASHQTLQVHPADQQWLAETLARYVKNKIRPEIAVDFFDNQEAQAEILDNLAKHGILPVNTAREILSLLIEQAEFRDAS